MNKLKIIPFLVLFFIAQLPVFGDGAWSSVMVLGLGQYSESGLSSSTLIKMQKDDESTPHFVLFDCGEYKSFQALSDMLKDACSDGKRSNKKILIDAVVVSHNHPESMGALSLLLKSKKFKVLSVFYTDIGNNYMWGSFKNKTRSMTSLVNRHENKIEFYEVEKLKNLRHPSKFYFPQKAYKSHNRIRLEVYGGITNGSAYRLSLGSESVLVLGYGKDSFKSHGLKAKGTSADNCSVSVAVLGHSQNSFEPLNVFLAGDMKGSGLRECIKNSASYLSNLDWNMVRYGACGVRSDEDDADFPVEDEAALVADFFEPEYCVFGLDLDVYGKEHDAEAARETLDEIKSAFPASTKFVEMTGKEEFTVGEW